MGFIAKNLDWLKDTIINRHLGQWAFYLNRLTGVIIALYLILHIYINSLALLFSGDTYTRILHSFETPLLKIFEVMLITAVAFHAYNGVRILLVDFCKMSRKQNVLLVFVFLFTIVTFIAVLILYWPVIAGTETDPALVNKL